MASDNTKTILHDVRSHYRAQPLDDEQAWLDAEIDLGLKSPPSKRSLQEIMAEQRRKLG